jgi:hypothetical protein
VVNPQIAVATTHNRRRRNGLYLLRHNADVQPFIAVVGKAVEPKSVVKTTKEDDVVFEPDVGPTSAAPTAEAPAAEASTSKTSSPDAGTAARGSETKALTVTPSNARRRVMRLSVSYPARGTMSGRPVMRGTARHLRRTARRRPFRMADLFTATTITRFWTIGRSLFCELAAVAARLEQLLAAAAAKI